MKNLKEIIDAVQDNNEINNSNWSDWSDADHIINVYCDSLAGHNDFYGSIDVTKKILNKAIKNNGETLENDMFKLKAEIGVI